MMSLAPRGSAPDRYSIPQDQTMQKLWTFTTTKIDGSLSVNNMQITGIQLALTVEHINISHFQSMSDYKPKVWS